MSLPFPPKEFEGGAGQILCVSAGDLVPGEGFTIYIVNPQPYIGVNTGLGCPICNPRRQVSSTGKRADTKLHGNNHDVCPQGNFMLHGFLRPSTFLTLSGSTYVYVYVHIYISWLTVSKRTKHCRGMLVCDYDWARHYSQIRTLVPLSQADAASFQYVTQRGEENGVGQTFSLPITFW